MRRGIRMSRIVGNMLMGLACIALVGDDVRLTGDGTAPQGSTGTSIWRKVSRRDHARVENASPLAATSPG